MEIIEIILFAIVVMVLLNIEQQSADNKQKKAIADRAAAVAREKMWRKQISINKSETWEFKRRFNTEPDLREEVARRIKAACAGIPFMDGDVDVEVFFLGGDVATEAFVNFASMIYYAQDGRITYFWEDGYVYTYNFNVMFRKLFGHDVPGFAVEQFFEWYQEELRENGFIWPDIDFVYERKEGAMSIEEMPVAAYFVNGPSDDVTVRMHCHCQTINLVPHIK